jgi:heat-inducible transcriptional repressor
LRFIRTRPNELLGVLVFTDGTVENRFIRVDPEPTDRDLERAHNMLAGVVEGRTLSSVRDHFAESANAHRDEVDALRSVGTLLEQAIGAGATQPEVIIEGQARLLARPEFSSPERLRDLIRALEDREQLVGLLDDIIEARRIQVLLGGETEDTVGYPVSLIAAPYDQDGRPGGAVGIIGPTPMDYPTLIPMVRATAEAMSAALSKGR